MHCILLLVNRANRAVTASISNTSAMYQYEYLWLQDQTLEVTADLPVV